MGATSNQLRWLFAGEVLIASTFGAFVGLALALLLRFLTPLLPIADRFFLSDLNPGIPAVAAILLSGPLIGTGVSLSAVRKVERSPLDVLHHANLETPGLRRLTVPIVGGVGLILTLAFAQQMQEIVLIMLEVGLFLTFLVGLMTAGPSTIRVLARWVGERTGLTNLWLASQRMAGTPNRAFRLAAAILLLVFLFSFLKMVGPSQIEAQANKAGQANRYRADLIVDLRGGRPQQLVEELTAIPGVRLVVPYGYGEGWVDGEVRHLLVGACDKLPQVVNIQIEGPCSPHSVFVQPGQVARQIASDNQRFNLKVRGAPRAVAVELSGRFYYPRDGSQLLVSPELIGEDWRPRELLLKTDGDEETYRAVLATVVTSQPAALLYRPDQEATLLDPEASLFQMVLSVMAGFTVLIAPVSLAQGVVGNLIESRLVIVVLRSIGMTKTQLKHLFIGEVALLTGLGVGIGIFLAVLLGTAVAFVMRKPIRFPVAEISGAVSIIFLGSLVGTAVIWKLWGQKWSDFLHLRE